MALIIPDYREPGAYSTIVPNPTTASSAGPPVVAIVGQALRGTYEPQTFFNSDDAQLVYGVATKSNPLSLGIQIAFENGASRVLGLNVEPTNSLPAYFTKANSGLPGVVICTQGQNTSTFPTSAFAAAPMGTNALLDPVTQQPVNTDGTIAGVFYIQDFDPLVPDPVLNSTPQATQQAFGLSAQQNLLQYIKYGTAPMLNGLQQVPFPNSNMIRVLVPANSPATAVPATSTYQSNAIGTVTQAMWNQLQNVLTLVTAINATPNCPVIAQILVPDTSQTAVAPVVGWSDMYASIGRTVNSTTHLVINSLTDAYAYAAFNGVLRISAIQPGTQHEIVIGQFAASTFDNSTGTYPFGLPTNFAGVNSTNPYILFANGIDGVVTNQSYIDAINNKLTTVRADVVVVLNPDSSLQQTIQDHVGFMSSHDERNERIAIVSGPISEQYTTTIQNVQAIQAGSVPERIVYIWPTGGYRNDPVLRSQITLDGTYLAAACAGILTSHDAAEPLTRKSVRGFTDIITKTTRTQANLIAQNGVCIIENNPLQGIRVRDGITCDPSTPESQEISVVRALDFTAQQVRDMLDLNFVAHKIVQGTLGQVQSMTKSLLQNLEDSQIIYGYKDVTVRISPLDPRQIDVRFTVRPAYPCKYIEITISVTSALDGLS